MKKTIAVLVCIVAANVAFWYVAGPRVFSETTLPAQSSAMEPKVVDVFSYTLREEVDKKLGQPIEGYEPAMFLEVFPGLTPTDFDGVEASIGYYTFSEGELQHILDDTKLIHSAAPAITRSGMEILLQNVSKRTGINLKEDGTLTDVMRYLIGV